MGDKDLAPLSTACVRALNDKLYDKRKTAAQEIEKMVKDFAAANNTTQLKKLLKVLGQDFAMSQNPHSRKGGLIGLAAMAIALGKDTSMYIDELVKPILACFKDTDVRVRYYACESLYNVVKIARGSVLPYFNDIFDSLSKLAADPDQNVKNGSELLDRLMKDIVTESSSFNLVAFMPLLRERIYTRNSFARQFIVSWIQILDAVPDIDMLILLPEVLDGLFKILDDSSVEIKNTCEVVLGEFLRNISTFPQKVNFSAMINILILHSQSSDELLQFTALLWIEEFIRLAGRDMLPFASGILTAVLPAMAYDDEKHKNIREKAKSVNHSLMQLIKEQDDHDTPESSVGGGDHDSKENEKLDSSNSQQPSSIPFQLDLTPMVTVLTRQLLLHSMQTKEAALRWIYLLLTKIPNKIFKHVEELFPILLKTLSDPSDEVILLDLEVLAEISSSSAGLKYQCKMDIAVSDHVKDLIHRLPGMNCYFIKFMVSLLSLFNTDQQLLEDRGSFIIRQLCLLLNSEDIYLTLSEILLHEDDVKFASTMVQNLNCILLTSTELYDLRNELNLLKTEESCSLFICLYRSWCHNPVATVSLCLLTQNYKHASELLQLFGDLEVTLEFLTEIDKLVQLIESPIFTYLRLQLLDVQRNQYLVKSLYGLLMLLPQSEAFKMLLHRLNCVPTVHLMPPDENPGPSPEERPCLQKINFKELLQHFQQVQHCHKTTKRTARLANLMEKTMGTIGK